MIENQEPSGSRNFQRFIGIDWSGAIDPRRGLRVAQCFPGTGAPSIVANGAAPEWRRAKVLDWFRGLHSGGERVLAGFDFAFAYPYCDANAYFPGHARTPEDAVSLWALIDSICREAPDFYGGPFYKSETAPFADYLLYQNYKGRLYSNRMRITDDRCRGNGGNPSSVFKCVGPESVGSGSVAGMRFLHEVSSRLNKDLTIWPFQQLDERRSVVVEIFPRVFYKLAGVNPRAWRDRDQVNKALEFFHTEALPAEVAIESEDQIDALVSAAAIRSLANEPKTWQPTDLKRCARLREGWIFGVA